MLFGRLRFCFRVFKKLNIDYNSESSLDHIFFIPTQLKSVILNIFMEENSPEAQKVLGSVKSHNLAFIHLFRTSLLSASGRHICFLPSDHPLPSLFPAVMNLICSGQWAGILHPWRRKMNENQSKIRGDSSFSLPLMSLR